MRRTMMTGLALMALAVSAAGVARPARADTVYTLKDLGSVIANAVNDSGQVTGLANPTAISSNHAPSPGEPRRWC